MKSSIYPPSEDTFLLADSALEAETAAEVGCGSGAATISLAEKAAYLVAVDIHADAAFETKRRLKSAALDHKTDVVVADMLSPFRDEAFHVVYSNPPYLPCPYEGEELWCGGDEGVEFSTRLSRQAWTRLRKQGFLVIIASTLSNTGRLLDSLGKMYTQVKVHRNIKVGLYEELIVVEAFKGV